MKNQKGITLVALIITIIVMLILVAVSVSVVINSNILGSAQKAGQDYKNAAETEGGDLPVNYNGAEYTNLEDIANQYSVN